MDSARLKNNSVALIGMAGKFPGASNIEKLWDNLVNNIDSVTQIPDQRWSADKFYHAEPATVLKSYCNRGGFLDDVEFFANEYFGISEDEAALLDPKQRLLLETAHHLLLDSGYQKDRLKNYTTGVFIGSAFDYHARRLRMHKRTCPHGILGNHNPVLANRISHYFDLKGPSLYINTFCSSSLIAVHLACQSILRNECDLAIVGGVHILDLDHYISLSQIRALSAKGRCSAFDQSADGFVPGEGVGAVLLKPMVQALADNDEIYAIIKGSAINHTGKANHLASPRREAQEQLFEAAYRSAGIDCDTVSFIETHGTGTILGDLIEFRALNNYFSQHSPHRNFCALGSIKANIGHLEPASGIAGLIKAALCLKYRRLPGLLHFKKLNRFINIDDSPFYVHSRTKEWDCNGRPRRAGVSSFGLSGSSAHVILEEMGPRHNNRPKPLSIKRNNIARRKFPLASNHMIAHEHHLGLAPSDRSTTSEIHPPENIAINTIQEDVRRIISRKISIGPMQLDDTTTLDDLGIDSILHVEIVHTLIEQWPWAAAFQEDLMTAETLSDILKPMLEFIGHSDANDEIQKRRTGDEEKAIVKLLYSLKEHPENIVCNCLPNFNGTTGPLITELLVDENHMFFFDHPLDHVSGIHLIESMLQTVATDYMRLHQHKTDAEIVFSEINAEFKKKCPKSEGITIEATALPYLDLREASRLYIVKIKSDQVLYCQGSIKVGLYRQGEPKNPPVLPEIITPLQPCQVNKQNPENVLISESARGLPVFNVRPLGRHPFFSDPKGHFLPTLYTLEAFRQAQRYLDKLDVHHDRREKNSFLLKLGVHIYRPVSRLEAVQLHTWRKIVQIPGPQKDHININGQGRILADKEMVGECRTSIIQSR